MEPDAPMNPALLVEKYAWNRLVECLVESGALGQSDAADRVMMAALVKWGDAFAEFRVEAAMANLAEEAAHPEET